MKRYKWLKTQKVVQTFKIRGEEARRIQIDEVKRSEEIERENLKKIEERRLNNLPEQEKADQS